MKPKESVSLGASPGLPTPADPVEILAYALWNDGHQDEAIAVLERQIALEKKLAEHGSGLPSHTGAPSALPERGRVVAPAPASHGNPTHKPAEAAPTAATTGGRALTVVSAIPRAPAAVNDQRPGVINRSADWNAPAPGRGLAWLLGLVLFLAGMTVLWARMDRDATEVAQPASREAPPVAQPATPAVKARAPAVANAEPEAEVLETPAEEVLDTPPAEDGVPAAAPDAPATPRPRPEPQAPATAEPRAVEPPPERAVAAPAKRAPAPPRAARPPPPQDDARAARARRLAERREAAERYVARRRAEAERRAAQRRGAAAPPSAPAPTREGPSILLGGRGLPN